MTIDGYHADKGDNATIKSLDPSIAALMQALLRKPWMQELYTINILAMFILRRSDIAIFNKLGYHLHPSIGRSTLDLLMKTTIKPSKLKSGEFDEEEIERYIKAGNSAEDPNLNALFDLLPYKVENADLNDVSTFHLHLGRAEAILSNTKRTSTILEESDDSWPGRDQLGVKSE